MSGYDNFFKNAKKAKTTPSSKPKSKSKSKEPTAEEYLRAALQVQPSSKRKSSLPIGGLVCTLAFIVILSLGILFPHEMEDLYSRFEVIAFDAAVAADESESTEKNSQTSAVNTAGSSLDGTKSGDAKCIEQKGFVAEELSHFNKLNERKKELDRRDAELTELEEELHKQRAEVETRISKLEQIREEVASALKDRVEVDQQRVSTLVDFYSNMKPKQAAEIFSALNEDLAVEVLSKMKKKNAADIMNLLDPTKARALSEKFTGYKRR